MTNRCRNIVLFGVLYLLSAVMCIVLSIQTLKAVHIIKTFISSFFLAVWARFFITAFPAVTLTGIALGYTYQFAGVTSKNDSTINYEYFFVKIIKNLCIVALVFAAVTFLCRETVIPIADHTCASAKALSGDYENARIDLDVARLAGDDKASLDALNRLLTIDASDKEFFSQRENVIARMKAKKMVDNDIHQQAETADIQNGMNLTFSSALEKAEAAKETESWFDMHYYASIGIKLADDRNPDRDRVLHLASEAWNKINHQQNNFATREEVKIYAEKLKGYGALQQEDYLKAYYTFKDLQRNTPNDPDVLRYLNISREGLENSYFFIDETKDLTFKSNHIAGDTTFCNFFLLRTPEDAVKAVYFGKIAWKENDESRVLYVQDFEALEFSAYGTLLSQIRAPYAKIFPCNISDTEEENWQAVALLTAVDEQHDGHRFEAEVIGNPLFSERNNFMILDVSITELTYLMEKKPSLSNTPLLPLISLYGVIEKFGFSQASLLAELIFRVTYPLLLLLMIFLTVWCSWKFRISDGRRFKKRYFCFAPLFFVILYVIIQFFEHVYKCLVSVSVVCIGIHTVAIALILFFVFLIWTAISLSCQRNA